MRKQTTNSSPNIKCTMKLMPHRVIRATQLIAGYSHVNTKLGINLGENQRKNIVRVKCTTSSWLLVVGSWLMVLLAINYQLPTINSTVHAASIAEGYPSEANLIEGTLVTLSNNVPPQVELANVNNQQFLVGVVEKTGESLLTLNKDGSSVLVATSGEVTAFVSDLGGDIKVGDSIGTSWINGVGMRADVNSPQKLLGVALESFNAESANTISVEDVDTTAGSTSAKVGKIAIRLYEREVGSNIGGEQPSALEKLAIRIAGKDVSFARVVAAFGLFTISAIISGVFLANAIRSSLISLGRNPLAHSQIFATLTQVSGVSIGLILLGSAIAYVVLII